MTDTVITSGAAMMTVVRDAMHTEDVRTMARQTQLSKSALYAIRRGKTKWPRDYTLFAITTILGVEVIVRRRGR